MYIFYNRKKTESYRQVERFFECVRALMSHHLRYRYLLFSVVEGYFFRFGEGGVTNH